MIDDQNPCEKSGCDKSGIPCWLDDGEGDPEYLCAEHAFEAGYCSQCGVFWGGIDEFDFGRIRGLCPNCRDEVEADTCASEPGEDYEPELDELF